MSPILTLPCAVALNVDCPYHHFRARVLLGGAYSGLLQVVDSVAYHDPEEKPLFCRDQGV